MFYCSSVFPNLKALSPPFQGSLVSCLLSLLQQMDEGHYKHTWEGLNQQQQLQQTTGNAAGGLRTFLLECFLLFQVLITGNVFPAGWQLMRLKAGQVMLNAMQVIYTTMPIGYKDTRHISLLLYFNDGITQSAIGLSDTTCNGRCSRNWFKVACVLYLQIYLIADQNLP